MSSFDFGNINRGSPYNTPQDEQDTVPEKDKADQIPATVMIHALENPVDLREAIIADAGVSIVLGRKIDLWKDDYSKRTKLTLSLSTETGQMTVEIWVIPLFMNGSVVHLLYAADRHNRSLLLEHRSPTKATHDYI